jgi:branched-chain amino acid aminotransferase
VSLQIYIDGQFYDKENAKISVYDHTFLYGDGVFEGIRVYEGCIFRLQEHLERICSSARYIMLNVPLTIEELTQATAETVRRNNIRNGYIRLVISRGSGPLGLSPWLCPNPSVVIIADSITLYPAEFYEHGLKLATAATTKNPLNALNGRVKSCNYLNNILAKIEGHNAGCVEALMLNSEGYVVECTGDNIFIIKKGKITTPPSTLGALEGVTRNCIMEIAREKGYELTEAPFTRFELMDADEVFLTGTAAEAIPVVELDRRVIGSGQPGPITRELIGIFRERTATDGYQVY